ncbi:hypothetical protein Ddye_023540 [Dipteronia dyeriana]|uniref:RNase H type-1 domain-containing protein n=1 Tax=Dipteronia dyeriana TaxID=168575 RepID=A0AAD9WTF2_9ROSI|nr:hypothetical protein Ddye_023540 [Dipteronia dyeriana]
MEGLNCLLRKAISLGMIKGSSNAMEKLQHSLFWGNGVEKRKVHSVDWASICKSKKRGGLGVGRILDKNRSLLAKWVCHFGKKASLFWKRVICAKYGSLVNDLMWDLNASNSGSFSVKAIQSLFVEGSYSARVLKHGLKVVVVVGDETRARLWTDLGGFIDQVSLMHLNNGKACIDTTEDKRPNLVVSSSLAADSLKFSVDGSVQGILDSIVAEIMAIQKACELCTLSRKVVGRKVSIMSDYKVVVSWVNNEAFDDLDHVNIIYDIRCKIRMSGNIEVVFNYKSSNTFVEMLAKKGSRKFGDFVVWGDT